MIGDETGSLYLEDLEALIPYMSHNEECLVDYEKVTTFHSKENPMVFEGWDEGWTPDEGSDFGVSIKNKHDCTCGLDGFLGKILSAIATQWMKEL